MTSARRALRRLKSSSLHVLNQAGAFDYARDSDWRRQRLLILCYHGISQSDEHLWDDQLYMSPEAFEARLTFLRDEGYRVLDLGEALTRLYKRDLPPRSVAITIDDGAYDCYCQAFPLLKKYQFPFTVYQTTYYCDFNRPPFRLICSYMMWKQRGSIADGGSLPGVGGELDLRTAESRQAIVTRLDRYTKDQGCGASQLDELAAQLAECIGIDYAELRRRRVLHLMTPEEVSCLSREGVSIQLHTHRHRTPRQRELFQREIQDNRRRIVEMTGIEPTHFCYPSGVHYPEFPGWLREERIVSATTCWPGIAAPSTDPFLLPRLVDNGTIPELDFAGWTTGIRAFLPQRSHDAVDPNL